MRAELEIEDGLARKAVRGVGGVTRKRGEDTGEALNHASAEDGLDVLDRWLSSVVRTYSSSLKLSRVG